MKKEEKLKILVTGGHLSPMLAVLTKLRQEAEVVVVGRKFTFEADKTESLEYATITSLGLPFYNLPSARLQRKLTRYTLPSLFRFPKAFARAHSILRKEKPDAVLTFGGYVGLPVSLAAKSLRIPVVLHEQTQKAGVSNKIIGKFAVYICVSHSSSKPYFKEDKTIVTGNPLRPELFTVNKSFDISLQKPLITIMGGSSGSHRINMYIKDILRELLPNFVVLHQTGDAQEFKDYDELSKFKRGLPESESKNYVLTKFIESEYIGWVFKHTDMFVSRSGMNTVSELIACSKKAVLIPLAYAQGGEQLENAKLYKKSGLGIYREEKDMDSQKLYNDILTVHKMKAPLINTIQGDEPVLKICDIVVRAAQHENAFIQSI